MLPMKLAAPVEPPAPATPSYQPFFGSGYGLPKNPYEGLTPAEQAAKLRGGVFGSHNAAQGSPTVPPPRTEHNFITEPWSWLRGGVPEAQRIVTGLGDVGRSLRPGTPQATGPAVSSVGQKMWNALPQNPTSRLSLGEMGSDAKHLATVLSPGLGPAGEAYQSMTGTTPGERLEQVRTMYPHAVSKYTFGGLVPPETVESGIQRVENYKPNLLDTLALPAAGAALRGGPLAAGLRNDYFTGAGALRNTAGGFANMGEGALGMGRGAPGAGATFMRGVGQAGVKAPAQMILPSVAAGAAGQLEPETTQNPVNKYVAPGGAAAPRMGFGNPVAPAAMMLGQLGQGGEGVPSATEYVGNNLKNWGAVGSAVANQLPAAKRVIGNALGDFGRGFTAPLNPTGTPQARYEDLAQRYNAAAGQERSGLTGFAQRAVDLKPIADEVATLPYRSPHGAEFAQRSQLQKALQDRMGPGSEDAIRQFTGRDLPSGMPFPTARDQETAAAQVGQLPGPHQAANQQAFGSLVDDAAKQLAPPANPEQPGGRAPMPPAPVLQADPGFVHQAPQVGQTLQGMIQGAGGDISALTAQAAQAQPPSPSLAGYWNSLGPQSRILAMAGLSIAAITAFRSMFGGDEDESFLGKVLPYLGLGAAAWGLGGGTLGFGRENLPETAKYRQLGGALQNSVQSLFN